MAAAELVDGGLLSHGLPVLRMPSIASYLQSHKFGDQLFDLATDPEELHNLVGEVDRSELDALMVAALESADAPAEEYVRIGLR